MNWKLALVLSCVLFFAASCSSDNSDPWIGTYTTTQQESGDCYYVCVNSINQNEDSASDTKYAICVYKQFDPDYTVMEGAQSSAGMIFNSGDKEITIEKAQENKFRMGFNNQDYELTKIDNEVVFSNNDDAANAFLDLADK